MGPNTVVSMYNTYLAITHVCFFAMHSPIEEVNEELEILEQQSVAAADDNDDETSAVNVTIILSLNEKHDVEKDDREILTAILTDGHYDISSDDRFVLESVLTTLNMPSQ